MSHALSIKVVNNLVVISTLQEWKIIALKYLNVIPGSIRYTVIQSHDKLQRGIGAQHHDGVSVYCVCACMCIKCVCACMACL